SCAWADAVNASNSTTAPAAYFLACSLTPNPIALCYYSGKPGLPDNTPSCTFSQGVNAAQCNCYEISSTNAPGGYSYVEITAILNQDLYNKVVSECVENGAITKCLTYADIVNHTQNPPMQSTTLCDDALTTKPNGLFPGADLVSDFYDVGKMGSLGIPAPVTPGASCPPGGSGSNVYAACMTAPCKHTNKIDPKTGLFLASC